MEQAIHFQTPFGGRRAPCRQLDRIHRRFQQTRGRHDTYRAAEVRDCVNCPIIRNRAALGWRQRSLESQRGHADAGVRFTREIVCLSLEIARIQWASLSSLSRVMFMCADFYGYAVDLFCSSVGHRSPFVQANRVGMLAPQLCRSSRAPERAR